MKSIKYLLIAIITLLAYNSDFPKYYYDMRKEDWIFLIGFFLSFAYGVYLKVKNK